MKTTLRLTAGMVLLATSPLSAATLYVSRGNANPTPPYDTWATAAANIQDAVDAAQPQALILVTNGVYPGGLTVAKRLTLMGINGPRFTLIDGNGVKQCVSITNGVNLSGFTLTNGWAQNGGAVWCSTTNAYVTNCVIAGNSAAQNGGGTYGATFYNCTLTGNSATNGIGGGAYSSMLYNCTVSGNSASFAGGASGGILYNSIIYFNNAPRGANYTNVYYLMSCCTTPMPGFGTGNITNAPLFVNEVGGDLHLQSNSPCIDAGNNTFVYGTTDLDGNPRIFGGTVDLGAYEFEPAGPPLITAQPLSQTVYAGSNVTFTVGTIGTLPFSWQWQFNGVAIPGALNSSLTLVPVTTNQAGSYCVVVTNTLGSTTSQVAVLTVTNSAPWITLQPLSQTAYIGSNVTFSVGAAGSLPFSWQWQFNGSAIPNATNSSVTLIAVTTNQAGFYSVIVSNALGNVASAQASLTIAVRTGTSFVWQNSPSPTPPYATWPTAAHEIQDAVDATLPGDQVVVTNGTYATGGRAVGQNALPNRVAVDRPVTVRSVNGPEVTVIMGYQVPGETNGYAAIRCVYLSSGAVLSGFTLAKGATLYQASNYDPQASGGGVWCESSSAVVTNCILNGNAAAQFSGGADGGTLDNCALSGNSALYGGGAHGGTLNQCTLSGNWAQYGGGAHVATLNNCTLTGNSAQAWGGGAETCTLLNSAVFGNLAQANGGGAAFCTLTNCTLTFNSAAVYDGGAYASTLYNSIVYYNTVLNSTKTSDAMSSTLYYCCSTTNSGGNTITNEPVLLSPWRPAWNSPVRGAGNAAYASGLDLDGETWLNPPSIGCDEYHSGSVTGALSVAIVAPVTNVAKGVALDLSGLISGRASAARWEFGDGTVISNRLHATHQWSGVGDYQVVWRAYNDDFPAGVIATVTIHVLDISLRYVNLDSTTPIAPYTSWGTAATNIQDAVDASTPGDEILVTNGLYATGGRAMGADLLTNRVALNKPLTVRSVNGPEVTVIKGYHVPGAVNGPGAIRCVYLSAGSVLSGFTLTNGATLAQPSYSDPQANGGGAWCESSTAVLTNCTLSGNSALSAGGAFGGTLNNCTVTSNSAAWYGGGAYGATLNNCALSGNSAYGGAGAYGGALNNCILTGNSAEWYGGGAENCTLYNCTLTQNSSGEYGGGVSHATLYNCTLTGNSGQGVDGGTLYNCRLFSNSGGSDGTFYSCLLVGNVGPSSGTFNNCTVVQNQGGISGSALNSIIYYNFGGNYARGTILNYSCTTPLPDTGLGNIAANPQLASPQSLTANSPCRGAGTTPQTTTDIDGDPWASPPSIGCYEYHAGPLTGPLSVNLSASYTNVAVGFPVEFTALIGGQTTVSTWDFADGTVLSNKLNAAHSWAAPGDYSVALRAYNDTSPGGVGATLTVHVVATPVYYVAATSANPQPPYSSWATAATNIQNAVDGALPGTLVLVTNGIYAGGLAVGKPLTLVGVSGPQFTVIDGGRTNQCASLASCASLTGFTLTNGAGFFGGGAQCASTDSFLTNCTLAGNSALSGAGISGGTLYNCTLSGNLGDGGGGASGSTLYNCTLTGNSAFGRVSSGGGAESCTLYNCTLRDNLSGWSGGGAADSTLNNCILTGNSSEFGPGGGAAHSTLNNCTLTGNSATNGIGGGGGGTYWSWLYNCISYFNTSPAGANYETNNYYSTLNYCCTTPLPGSGVGNITNAPLFVDYAGGNLRLQSTSPCINAGNNAFVFGTTDLDGNPRIVGTVDMGAYEYQGSGSLISYAWLQQWGLPTDGSVDYVDTDGDGMNNWQEWVCGTCPTNPLSVLRLLSASTVGGNVTVTWQSVTGINYFLERCAQLNSSFTYMPTNALEGTNSDALTNIVLVATNVVGQPGTTTYTDTNAAGRGTFLYRVGVRSP